MMFDGTLKLERCPRLSKGVPNGYQYQHATHSDNEETQFKSEVTNIRSFWNLGTTSERFQMEWTGTWLKWRLMAHRNWKDAQDSAKMFRMGTKIKMQRICRTRKRNLRVKWHAFVHFETFGQPQNGLKWNELGHRWNDVWWQVGIGKMHTQRIWRTRRDNWRVNKNTGVLAHEFKDAYIFKGKTMGGRPPPCPRVVISSLCRIVAWIITRLVVTSWGCLPSRILGYDVDFHGLRAFLKLSQPRGIQRKSWWGLPPMTFQLYIAFC